MNTISLYALMNKGCSPYSPSQTATH